MPVGLRRVLPVATTVLIALAVPAVAVAGSGGGGQKCNASACKVYVEPGVVQGGQETRSNTAQKPVRVSKKAAQTLAAAGKDRKVVTQLLTNPGYGAFRGFKSSAGQITAPTALGAVFDLGSGPTALLAILIATAFGLAVHGGVRRWRQRRLR